MNKLLLLLAVMSLPAFAQKKTKLPAPVAPVAPLDLSKPEEALKASRKLQSSLTDGEPAVFYWEGNVFSRVPGERDRLLFTYIALNTRASQTVQDTAKGYGYKMVSRELLLYMDPKTKQILQTWRNPWTNKDVEVIHIQNDPVNQRPQFSKGYESPFYLIDGMAYQRAEIPLFYPNPLAGAYQANVGGAYQAIELFNFAVPVADLTDATKSMTDNVTVAWSRVSKWLPWMEMGDYTGQLVFTGLGKKLSSFEKVPEPLKSQIKQNYAIYASPPPLDDARPNETSWSYFKKIKEAQKK